MPRTSISASSFLQQILLAIGVLILVGFPEARAALQITSPAEGTVVAPGDTVAITVVVTPGSTYSLVQVLGEDLGFSDAGTAPPYVLSMTIPDDTVGPHLLTAVGVIGPDQADFSPPVTLQVETPAIITSLSVDPSDEVAFEYVGEQVALTVTGRTDAGALIDLSDSSQTRFQSADSAIAAVAGGFLTAVGPGATTVSVSYKNLNVIMPVTVPKSIPGDLDANGAVDQDDLNLLLDFVTLGVSPTGLFDARDLNHDGVIDQADVAQIQSLCTQPPCVIPNANPVTTTAAVSPAPNTHGWNNSDVTVNLSATDSQGGSGVKQIVYSASGAQSIPNTTVAGASASILFTAEGVTTLSYFAASNAGNVEAAHTLTIRIGRTAPEAFYQFDPARNDVAVFGRDALSGVPSGPAALVSAVPGDDGTSEIRSYKVVNLAGNSLVMVLEKELEDRRIMVHIVSLQYNNGAVVAIHHNEQHFASSSTSGGALNELDQEMKAMTDNIRHKVEAEFEAGKNQTTISIEEPEPETKMVKPGLVLLRLVTDKGQLHIEF
jgi:hypothetical protein